MTPFFSIIIPVYNAELYLERCINSIIAQKFEQWELLLIDDGSVDDSWDICTKSAKKDNRIKAFHQDNAGPSAARNSGIANARGEYICFIDADDWLEDEMLTAYQRSCISTKFDILFQGFTREKDGVVLQKSFATDLSTENENKENIICKLYKGRNFGWAWNKAFRRSIIEKNNLRFHEGIRLWEDELFTIQFLHYADSIKCIKCWHYHYIHYQGSLMNSQKSPFQRLRLTELLNKNLDPISNLELKKYTSRNYCHSLKFIMLMALMNKPEFMCKEEEKKELIQKYYKTCRKYPKLVFLNVLKNRFSYIVAECILASHCPMIIIPLFKKIG